MFAVFNTEQLECYTKIPQAVATRQYESKSQSFFLHGPAGIGKTFLYKFLCSCLRAKGQIVLCVASSRIAAQLLPGGRTAHSRFKIPLSNDIRGNCNITKNSNLAELLRQTALIIWDEVPMQHKAYFEAVNRTLNNICGRENDSIFGGILIVLRGGFRVLLTLRADSSKINSGNGSD